MKYFWTLRWGAFELHIYQNKNVTSRPLINEIPKEEESNHY
jgi:hypothetical protein